MPGTAIPMPNWQTDANDGSFATGGKIYFWVPGTNTPRTPWQDTGLSTPTSNPVILNATGWPETPVYFDSSLAYEYEVKSANDEDTYKPRTLIPANISGAQPVDATLSMYSALGMEDGKLVRGTATDAAELIDQEDIEVTDSGEGDTNTLEDWMARVDRKDPTTLQVQRLNFSIVDDPTATEARRVGAHWLSIESETNSSTAGTWLNYFKSGRLSAGNELGRVLITRWDDIAAGTAWADWMVGMSPLDPASGLPGAPALSQSFGIVMGESNAQQRYGDGGYVAERRLATRYVGGFQWTPETQDFVGNLGGVRKGFNVLFQHVYTHSPYTATDTQLQAKTYNLHLVEPNAVAPGGVVVMAQGHRPFVASAAIDSGGSAYVAGDVGKVVTVTGGGGSDLAATVEITEVTAGAVTAVRMYTGGRYDSAPSSPAATSGGGTTGSGLTLTLTMSTASNDPNAIIDADDYWKTGFDFRKATFRDSVLGNNQAMRFVQPQGLSWSATAGGTPYNAFGVNSANVVYVAPIDNATGISLNTRLNGKSVLFVDTSVGASITDYLAVKATNAAGGELQAQSSNANAHIVLRPKGTGDILPATDGAINLGGGSNRFDTVYATTGTINTSDARFKTEVAPLIEQERRAIRRVMAGVGTFRWLDAVARKGTGGARIHIGPTAQAVEQAFLDEGLDPGRYALFCEDEVTAEIERDEIVTEQVRRMVEVQETVTSLEPGPIEPAKDADGNEILDEKGNRIMVRGPAVESTFVVTKSVEAFGEGGEPLFDTVETVEKRIERIPVLDENGRPMRRKGLRPDQLMMLGLAVLFEG